ncbi:MAG: phosphonate ABC transporter ATP-binding protein [Chloroflexi bacterium]|nr:phosphonate ABC transporter ATP-binding protein [Chloroflexota bacterium]
MLEIQHLTKRYPSGTLALDDISFSVPDGQFLVIIGLSGSGKSTLLRCINRLIEPTVHRSTVMTNVLAGRLGYANPLLSTLGVFSEADKQRAMASLQRVGIADKAAVRADTLSGGQQQRVGIARALMQEPKLLLADEPVASLDPAISHSVMKYIQQLNRQDNVTVLCSLHFLDLARAYGHRIIALKAGRIVFDGLPKDIDEKRFKEIYGEEAVEVNIR